MIVLNLILILHVANNKALKLKGLGMAIFLDTSIYLKYRLMLVYWIILSGKDNFFLSSLTSYAIRIKLYGDGLFE